MPHGNRAMHHGAVGWIGISRSGWLSRSGKDQVYYHSHRGTQEEAQSKRQLGEKDSYGASNPGNDLPLSSYY